MMTQTNTKENWLSEIEHLSGIATVSTKTAEGLGALHLRLQVDREEVRFMFSAQDFSRLVSGKMIRGYDRDDFNEENNPIIAKKLGDLAVFEVYGTHRYEVPFSYLRDLWSFEKQSILISGPATMPRTETIIRIAQRAMDRLSPADLFPCKKVGA
jgi:hypothetical protein